ncbi:MAG: RagB/SusD family nutrient uptake outer membrane protein [Paludibacter sp.]|nr:RagB/SusD family nutrient uptake outer membrane protein [Paludibacter sp.]
MKKYFYLVSILSMFLSCSNDFLETKPYDSIGTNNMWNSESKADQGVAGIYNILRSSTTGGTNYKIFDGLGFVNTYYGTSDPFVLEFLKGSITPSSSIFSETWKQHYEGIHRANNAIANLKKAGLTDEKYNRLICESKFLRAFFYYRLNALFKGVPIYTEPVNADEVTRTQSSVEEVYDQCIQDLGDCIDNSYFPRNTLTENYGRASKGATYALRGMVYMWKKEYKKAIDDFLEVEKCGYGLWQGNWGDFFKFENEKDKEMIFPLQWDEALGFSSQIQKFVGGRSHYDGWTEAQPSSDFVDSFLNADGSTFNWEDYLPGWNNMTVAQREVFFLRDGLSLSSTDSKIKTAYNDALNRIGTAAMTKYLVSGNEARIKNAYANRDPRLQKTVFTPYSEAICYSPYWNSGEEHLTTLRWPLISNTAPYWDMWNDKRSTAFYMYKKYNETRKGRYIDRDRCSVDFPLIRYTDVVLLLSEAYNEDEQIDKSIEQFNRIRTRKGVEMPSLTITGFGPNVVQGKEDMRERIRYERRVELALEGINYFDELRWGTWKLSKFNGGQSNAGRKSWWGYIETSYYWKGDYITTWPVPTKEVQMNPNLKPTAGWSY